MKGISILLLAPALMARAGAAHPTPQGDSKVRFHAVDAAGHAKPAVEVYAVGSYLEGLMVNEVGKTNARGVLVSDDDEGDFVAIASDGSVATSHNSAKLVLGNTGYLTIQVVDDHGKPQSGVLTTLIPPVDKAALKPFGQNAYLNDLPKPYAAVMSRTTDSAGFARFKKLPLGRRFGVVVHAGVGDMRFEGSAPIGRMTQAVIANDREVTGHVYRRDGTTPIAGADVQIAVSAFSGNGAPDRTWRDRKTDASGAYRLPNLPNCKLEVYIDGGTPGIVMSSVNRGPWRDRGVEGRVPAEGYTFEMGTGDIPANLHTTIDYRVEEPAIVTVTLRNPRGRDLSKAFMGIAQLVNGRMPDGLGGTGCDSPRFIYAAGYGRYALFIQADSGTTTILRTLDIKDASPIHVAVDVP